MIKDIRNGYLSISVKNTPVSFCFSTTDCSIIHVAQADIHVTKSWLFFFQQRTLTLPTKKMILTDNSSVVQRSTLQLFYFKGSSLRYLQSRQSNPDYYLHAGWMHVKLALVGLLWLYHLGCGHFRLMFAMDANTKSSKFYRVYNEIPTLLLVGIVFAVVLK